VSSHTQNGSAFFACSMSSSRPSSPEVSRTKIKFSDSPSVRLALSAAPGDAKQNEPAVLRATFFAVTEATTLRSADGKEEQLGNRKYRGSGLRVRGPPNPTVAWPVSMRRYFQRVDSASASLIGEESFNRRHWNRAESYKARETNSRVHCVIDP